MYAKSLSHFCTLCEPYCSLQHTDVELLVKERIITSFSSLLCIWSYIFLHNVMTFLKNANLTAPKQQIEVPGEEREWLREKVKVSQIKTSFQKFKRHHRPHS